MRRKHYLYEMLDQTDLIHNSEWATLVILDACRFDFFKKCNKFKGRLLRAESPAPHTWTWLQKTFPDKYPWLYFSAHMWIGDKIRYGKPWNGVNHFKKVLPIWEVAFNDKLGTVHPDAVGEYVKEYFAVNPPEKCIIHYVQPHGPWIGPPHKWVVPWTKELHARYDVMADYVADKEKPPEKFMRQIYKSNLRFVLKSIEKYREYFPGKIVITADHGEMLGEKGLYLHKHGFPEWADKLLREVPWFLMD